VHRQLAGRFLTHGWRDGNVLMTPVRKVHAAVLLMPLNPLLYVFRAKIGRLGRNSCRLTAVPRTFMAAGAMQKGMNELLAPTHSLDARCWSWCLDTGDSVRESDEVARSRRPI
jgi:hypothetical protein